MNQTSTRRASSYSPPSPIQTRLWLKAQHLRFRVRLQARYMAICRKDPIGHLHLPISVSAERWQLFHSRGCARLRFSIAPDSGASARVQLSGTSGFPSHCTRTRSASGVEVCTRNRRAVLPCRIPCPAGRTTRTCSAQRCSRDRPGSCYYSRSPQGVRQLPGSVPRTHLVTATLPLFLIPESEFCRRASLPVEL